MRAHQERQRQKTADESQNFGGHDKDKTPCLFSEKDGLFCLFMCEQGEQDHWKYKRRNSNRFEFRLCRSGSCAPGANVFSGCSAKNIVYRHL